MERDNKQTPESLANYINSFFRCFFRLPATAALSFALPQGGAGYNSDISTSTNALPFRNGGRPSKSKDSETIKLLSNHINRHIGSIAHQGMECNND